MAEMAAAGSDLVMFDSIDLAVLAWVWANHRPNALAGYVGGNWPTWPPLEHLYGNYPAEHILSIAVFASEDAEFLDVETGDATIAQVYGWYTRQQARKAWRPGIYISAGSMPALLLTMNANAIARSSYRLWSAHYTGVPHICGPGTCGYPQADGTQWTSSAFGRSLDQSLLRPSFFPAPPKPPPPPVTVPLEDDVPTFENLTSDHHTWVSPLVPAGKRTLLLSTDAPGVYRVAFGGAGVWELVGNGQLPVEWAPPPANVPGPVRVPVPAGAVKVSLGGTHTTPEPPLTIDWA